MEEHISSKIIPKELKIVLLALFSLFLLSLTVSEILEIKNDLRSEEKIVFSGEGEAIGIPDIASISLSVITEKLTAKEAMTDNAEKMNKVISFIKESGVDEKDVKTQTFSINPRYDWTKRERVFKGYEVRSTLAVKIRDLEKISDIIDGAVSRGANQVGNIQFVIDDPEELKAKARVQAIKNAEKKAQSVAKATGLKLGEIVAFSETSFQPPSPRYFYETAEAGVGGGDIAPDIEKGSLEIKVNVSLTFELK